ncbi:uncharacterized protein LOC125233483 [Leguminivora glycinivorella]|uniref:uncharacterized protein LOC125233483 n=1 Tax=Leguminivora glycinivorella TaxID=1035111 RepID=UPI00200F6FFE|nr:uncharacterized protein LOC125233483 [Leguminivora glycinivorella]
MPDNILFPYRSSFYFFDLRWGTIMVAAGDAVVSLVRLVLVLTRVEMFEKEHRFVNVDEQKSRIRYTILFGLNLFGTQLLGLSILIIAYWPYPVLMVPWLVIFLCCTWLYYSNIISHRKRPVPITICVLIMLICLYCWGVVFSYFCELILRMPENVLFPFRSSFYLFNVRVGSMMVVAGDALMSLVRLTLVLTRVEMFHKEHRFINMTLHESRIRYSVLFGLNLLATQLLGVAIILSKCRSLPVLMVPWLVMFLCCTWLYYPNIIYHRKKQAWTITICIIIMAICLYCWCVVLSFFLELLEKNNKPQRPQIVAAAAVKPVVMPVFTLKKIRECF